MAVLDLERLASDGLGALRDEVFRAFAAAVADRDSPYRTPTLATVATGGPSLRTVVLRSFEPARRCLTVHTDVRADKVQELRENRAVAVHVWDPSAQVQARLRGEATLHHRDSLAAEAWAALPPRTRATYAVAPAPGTALAEPTSYDAADFAGAASLDNFAVIAILLGGMDWLCLAGPKHRRARFAWRGGQEDAGWVVP